MGKTENRKVSTFQNYLYQRMREGVKNAKKLFFEIKELGYQGSYSSVYRHLRVGSQGPVNNQAIPHFETRPGIQAQVDWGTFGKIEINRKNYQLYSFVYLLGYSRTMHLEFTVRQDLRTFQECHIHAFEKLGIPKTILYDNIKTVVLRREKLPDKNYKFYYNPAFLNFADFYGFQIKLCVPHRPQTKGKVEAGIKYIRNNFMPHLTKQEVSSLEELNKKAKTWLNNVANVRIHAATKERPLDRWKRERIYLQFPSRFPKYSTSPLAIRNSTKDGIVQYKSNFYSVPSEFSRRKLFLKEQNKGGIAYLKIYFEDKIIARHLLSTKRGDWIIKETHIIQRKSFPKSKIIKLVEGLKKNKKKEKKFVLTRPPGYYDQLIPKGKDG